MVTDLDAAYLKVATFFDLWSRTIELQVRERAAREADLSTKRILVISPPTDRGIQLLGKANRDGTTSLLCFSDSAAEIAERYVKAHDVENVKILVEPFFRVPDTDGALDAVFANCFFDFLGPTDIAPCVAEIGRVLRPDGSLFAAYMDYPTRRLGRFWDHALARLPRLSQGCHPVDIRPVLASSGFQVGADASTTRLGFPLKYVAARA